MFVSARTGLGDFFVLPDKLRLFLIATKTDTRSVIGRKPMKIATRVIAAAALAGSAVLLSTSASAWWGGGPWYGGWGGYPYAWGGYPYAGVPVTVAPLVPATSAEK